MPVFTTREGAQRHWEANSGVRERLQMAEKTPITHQGTVLQNRFVVMPLTVGTLARAAAMVEADYLIRDPRLGAEQEILRLT